MNNDPSLPKLNPDPSTDSLNRDIEASASGNLPRMPLLVSEVPDQIKEQSEYEDDGEWDADNRIDEEIEEDLKEGGQPERRMHYINFE